MYFKIRNLFEIYLNNPFKYFNNKVRKVFKHPKIKLYICFKHYNWHTYNDSWFGLYSDGISWKDKYGHYTFEHEPYIQINFCGLCLIIKFKAPFSDSENVSDAYWESILEYYFRSLSKSEIDLKSILENNQWYNSNLEKFDNKIFLTKYGKGLIS